MGHKENLGDPIDEGLLEGIPSAQTPGWNQVMRGQVHLAGAAVGGLSCEFQTATGEYRHFTATYIGSLTGFASTTRLLPAEYRGSRLPAPGDRWWAEIIGAARYAGEFFIRFYADGRWAYNSNYVAYTYATVGGTAGGFATTRLFEWQDGRLPIA